MASDISDPAGSGRVVGTLTRDSQVVLIAGLVVLCVAISLAVPQFYSGANIIAILRQVALVLIVAGGMTMLLITGEVDLSVGASIAFVGVVAMDVINLTGSVALGCARRHPLRRRGRPRQRPHRHPAQGQFADRHHRHDDDPAGQRLPLFARGGAEPPPSRVLRRHRRRLCRPDARSRSSSPRSSSSSPTSSLRHTTLGRYLYAVGANEKAARLSGLRTRG